ncbi:Stf0 family sulfotransferase [Mycobacterium palustre]|uniref:Sulphotransferase Stf0 domain-containing protein n=1 Tax=Mycobacterium palustre TaxID=153971 RepID=A0A1X1Z098_9MYCO|nr:Stf0 family sulfotransferase [Mycobacterium palustre]ORW16788.1 hypothetical protein AWC19_21745 [Mycobacterium palustre]
MVSCSGSSRTGRHWGLYLARPAAARGAFDLTALAPTYEQIVAIERGLDAEQAAWTDYFTTRRCQVLMVRYEDLDADHRGEIARVLDFLGADPSHAARVPRPPLERQTDHVNEHWRRLIDQEGRRFSPR